MTGRFAPPKCPTCGQYSVKKEINNGIRTGDWICSKCGDEGMLSDEPWTKPAPPQKDSDSKQ